MFAKLEKYLTEQRDQLDVDSPDNNFIWRKIKADLHNRDSEKLNRKIRVLRIRNIAATAVVLFCLGYIANDVVNRKIAGKPLTLSSIDSGLGRRESEYKSLVVYKTREVESFGVSNDKVINQLFAEIRQLDQIYNQAMTDLKELGPDERVINTIFNTYEQKIRLLELIILETNKKSHENNEKTIY